MNSVRRTVSFFAALIGAVAVMAPWLPAQPAHALEGVTFYLAPGPQANGTSGYMDCGWHNVCIDPKEIGSGLDWRNADNAPVQFQGWAYRDFGTSAATVGFAYIGQRNGNCKTVVADLMDMYGNYIGRVEYKHSTLTVGEGSSSAINARATGYWNQRVGIAETITPAEDLATCTNLGAHLHQNTSFGSWGKYGGYPNEDGARGFSRDITAVGNAQNYTSWSY
jgi:hypothetical protein